jgi:drug/metabolite transporter (DMT)-like permease
MTRGQFAILGALLGAIVAGVFIIAFEANVGLNGGTDIRQHSRGIVMLVGAAVGFVVCGLFGGPRGGGPNSKPPIGPA